MTSRTIVKILIVAVLTSVIGSTLAPSALAVIKPTEKAASTGASKKVPLRDGFMEWGAEECEKVGGEWTEKTVNGQRQGTCVYRECNEQRLNLIVGYFVYQRCETVQRTYTRG
jgi:hypothetical protein